MAAGILDQTAMARQAVVNHNPETALDHIRQAMTLANEIEHQAPSAPRPLLVPVAKDIEKTTTYTPVKRGKDGEIIAKRLKKNTSIREVDTDTTTSQLDITASAERLARAEMAVQRGDWTTADTELAAIPNSIIRTQVEGNMPLLKARDNLMLARSRILGDQYKDAAAPLRAAAEALADFEKLSPGPQAEKAEAMRQEIEAYSQRVGRQHTHAIDRIDAWLDPINHWLQAVTQ